MAAISTNITTTLQILSDSIAGWLLIIVLTCTLPLINNILLKQLPPSITTTNITTSSIMKLHPSLPNIQSFQLLNCFVLYLLSFPILAMYRNVSTFGNIFGSLGFSIGLILLLGFGVGPAMVRYQEEVEAMKQEENVKEYYNKKEKERGDDDDSPWKQVNKTSNPAITLETSSHSLPESPTTPEEEDDTYGSPLQKHRNLSSSSLKKKQHRKSHSISTSDNDSLLKEMDGNLIDSNLEPHYSNLIDSANAPIFGVGKLYCLLYMF